MAATPPPALVLTAGTGTRLHPLTLVRAKPAVPIAGVPVVTGSCGRSPRRGSSTPCSISTTARRAITAIVGDGRQHGVTSALLLGGPVLGSGGGPRRALPLLDSDEFLLVNGDTLPTVDLQALWAHHRAHAALVTLTLIPNPAPERYGGVLVGEDGWVTGFCRRGDPGRPFISSTRRRCARRCSPTCRRTPTPKASAASIRGSSRRIRNRCSATSAMHRSSKSGRQPTASAPHGGSPSWRAAHPGRVATGSLVERGAFVSESVVWDRVIVESGAVVERAILADDVRVPAGLVLRDCAVVDAAESPPAARELSGLSAACSSPR